jgi:hypothetical protein
MGCTWSSTTSARRRLRVAFARFLSRLVAAPSNLALFCAITISVEYNMMTSCHLGVKNDVDMMS